ncbi:type 1 glutamine amidotransferase domain-containing protein [Shumkonia mesophila]|uniref:type 1 glutamine amidotransferase domain-containing protein n=1 Tax=Shumkonia mesophila TaxID=2838854 RepID=UPI002934EA51|nr:type 1 glutamine amidotransferase domain-containing protein [Shumkonia mesophila]
MPDLNGKKIAILATDGFEQSELLEPRRILAEAGAQVDVVSPKDGEIVGWDHTDWGESVPVDVKLEEARVENYDALVLPGGQINPDKLRTEAKAVDFVKKFATSGKPVGAICHGPWMLIEAGVVKGRRATSYPSIKTDMENAGCDWQDRKVVVDGNLITSRHPGDIPIFTGRVAEMTAAR